MNKKQNKQNKSRGNINLLRGEITRIKEEDDLWWKTTFGGRRPLVEDDLRWKTTFGGRRPMVEDNLRWKTIFGGRRSLHAA